MIEIDWETAGKAVNEAMLKRGLSSEFVAHKAGVVRRTVDRARKGQRVRIHNLSAIEQVLELEIISKQIAGQDHVKALAAGSELGGYSYESCERYIGNYYLFRRSYDYPDRIVCGHMTIFWDHDVTHLRFSENQRNVSPGGKVYRYNFVGDVALPLGLACTQFIGRYDHGFSRVMTCTSLRGDNVPYFKGILVGLNEIRDLGFYPATTPIYLEQTSDAFDVDAENPRVGSFERAGFWHKEADDELRSVSEKFFAS